MDNGTTLSTEVETVSVHPKIYEIDDEIRTVARTIGCTFEVAAMLALIARFDLLSEGFASFGQQGLMGMLGSMFKRD